MASSSAAAQAEAFPDGTTDYVPLRKSKTDLRKPHITDQPITLKNWYQHVNWLNTTFIIFIPLAGLISSFWVPLQFKTAIFSVAYYFFAGLGISTFSSSTLRGWPH
jgi:stearoyl-CoA desaturase (delta-9 desaturase)